MHIHDTRIISGYLKAVIQTAFCIPWLDNNQNEEFQFKIFSIRNKQLYFNAENFLRRITLSQTGC